MQGICLTSFFSNNISGTQGQTIEIQDQQTFDELVQAGYIKEAGTQAEPTPKPRKR